MRQSPTSDGARGFARWLIWELVTSAALLATIAYALKFFLLWFGIFYSNPEVRPGHVAYITDGAVFGKSDYRGIVYGPGSPGAALWRHAVDASLTPTNFVEEFKGQEGILFGGNTRISFAVNGVLRVRRGKNSEGVEWFKVLMDEVATLNRSDSGEKTIQVAYENFIKNRFKALVRQAADSRTVVDVHETMMQIQDEVSDGMKKLTANTPFETMYVTIAYVVLPAQITDQVVNNLVAAQETEQERIKVTLKGIQADIDKTDAEGLGLAADVLKRSMTCLWVQFKFIQALKKNVHSQTPTDIYVAVGAGGLPDVSLPMVLEPVNCTPVK